MDYLKIVKTGTIKISTLATDPDIFDTHGYMAKFKVINGSIYIDVDGDRCAVKAGEALDFIGKIKYYGSAEIHYILFDRT